MEYGRWRAPVSGSRKEDGHAWGSMVDILVGSQFMYAAPASWQTQGRQEEVALQVGPVGTHRSWCCSERGSWPAREEQWNGLGCLHNEECETCRWGPRRPHHGLTGVCSTQCTPHVWYGGLGGEGGAPCFGVEKREPVGGRSGERYNLGQQGDYRSSTSGSTENCGWRA